MPILSTIKRMWSNVFRENTVVKEMQVEYSSAGSSSNAMTHRQPMRFSNERTIITSIYTRIAIDVAAIVIRHIKVDDEDRYKENLKSGLNKCLLLQPNIDQGPRAIRQDICMTLFDRGVAAIVPVDRAVDELENTTEILSLRVGDVTMWYPKHVRVNLYNEATGLREEILLEKRSTAIVENPLYAVMNAPNSTLQRLIRKLNLLDTVDEAAGSGKLDLIIQLPYTIKSEARRQQAEKRREDIEFQLRGSQYGIAYTDGTEKITQLNRPAENNLLKQIEYLTAMLYSQLGITDTVMNGTADEATMLNYYNRTVEPILDAMVEAMQRAFLGIRGTGNQERVKAFRDPFKFVTASQMAEIADKFSRNEILSANEIRGYMGLTPSTDPKADQLVNSNMPQPETVTTPAQQPGA